MKIIMYITFSILVSIPILDYYFIVQRKRRKEELKRRIKNRYIPNKDMD